jgi:hypothetical protein
MIFDVPAWSFVFYSRFFSSISLRFAPREISTEPMSADKATPEAAQRTLTSEIDRWAPIIKAAGEYAD